MQVWEVMAALAKVPAGAELMVAHNKKGPFVSVDYFNDECANTEATDPYVVVIGNGVKDIKK